MSISRIKAIILQEIYITKNSLEVILDLFYFSIVSILLFGLFTLFITRQVNSSAAHYLLLGIMLWEIIRITQYSISVGSLWNIWSRNLSNMFIAPLSIKEYLFAEALSGMVKSMITFILISIISAIFFNFNVFEIGIFNFLLFFLNLSIFAVWIGIFILGLIFYYGTRISALAWGLVFIFQPLSAALFPVKTLPDFIQKISYSLPTTYVFEAARENLTNTQTNWNYFLIALLQNIFYFAVAILVFNKMFNKSKEKGQFARNEG